MDDEMDGFATGLSTCITKDGQTTPTANMPMGNFKHTGVADGSALTEYAAAGQVQDGSLVAAADSGTADTYAVTLTPAPSAYTARQVVIFTAGNASTGASTLNVNSLGAKTIKKYNDQDIESGDIESGQAVVCVYDGTNFQMVSLPGTGIDSADTGSLAALNTVDTAQIDDNAVTGAKIAMGSDAQGDVLYYDGTDYVRLAKGTANQGLRMNTGATAPEWGASVVQRQRSTLTTFDTSNTAIPYDDTIPQNTEGKEALTVSITPKNSNNKLHIRVFAFVSGSASKAVIMGLFQDSTASALTCGARYINGGNEVYPLAFDYEMTAGTTSATTFKVRYGGSDTTQVALNGNASARRFGGVMATTLTVTEYAA